MFEIIAVLVDIALGALAYRLGVENRKKHSLLEGRVGVLESKVTKLEEKCGFGP